MITGKVWLRYDVGGPDEETWDANITSAAIRGGDSDVQEVVVEFSGNDPEVGQFSGKFSAKKDGPLYIGTGSFTEIDGANISVVSVRLTVYDDIVSLVGTWTDQGDSAPYELEVELERS